MPLTSDRKVAGALTRADIEKAGVKPDDIDPDWLDEMVKRLFRELNRQLACIESTKPEDIDTKKASVRAANVRALSAIERTLERLAQMEQERIARRQPKAAGRNEELRAQLECRINSLLAARGLPLLPGRTQ
jgi:hypothetical protein